MLHIFHGDDTVSSRRELASLLEKHKSKERVSMSGKSFSMANLTHALESTSLFGNDRIVVIEDLVSTLTSGKKGKGGNDELPKIVELLLGSTHEVVLWESKELGKLVLKHFPEKVDRAVFNIRPLMFKFLESLAPKKAHALLGSFDEVLKQEAPELIFFMLVRQIRQLLIISHDPAGGSVGMAPWQASKLKSQARLFSTDQLVQSYQKLLQIEVALKRGESPRTLTSELKLFLVQL